MGHNELFESEVFQSYQGAAAAGGNTFMIGMPHEGPCPMVHVKPRGHQMASAFMHAGLRMPVKRAVLQRQLCFMYRLALENLFPIRRMA